MKRDCMKNMIMASACLALLSGNAMQGWAAPAVTAEIVQQNNKKITGQVVDRNGMEVIGANVVEKGTTNGTITDIEGRFTLNVPPKATLSITFIGYKTQDIVLKGDETQLKVVLEDDTEVLDEVVVVGYGTMKKRDLSGAVSQIKGDDLMAGNPTDLSKGMQGKIAGVVVNQSDGAPGGGVSIQVRGTNSFSTSTQPLYIVDGVPFDTGSMPSDESANSGSNQSNNPLSFINPHDIQSIEVLKDASATAIYGSRGANGVVIITTKRGDSGYDQVEFSANFSFSRIARRVEVLDAYTYANYINEEYRNSYNYYDNALYMEPSYSGTWYYTSTNSDGTRNGTYKPKPEDFLNPGYYTDEYGNRTLVGASDWQDMIYQDGFSQEYNISVSGGSEKGWHNFSGNYLDQTGIIKNSGYTRIALRANLGRRIHSWLEMGMNTSFTHTDTDFAKTNAYDYGVIRSSLIFPPTHDPSEDTTTSSETSWLASNPVAYINSAKDRLKAINIFNSSYAEVKLFPFLKFRQNLGVSYTNNNRGTYYGWLTQEGSHTNNINGKAGQSDNWYMSLVSESLLTFDKQFNSKHSLNAVFGFTAEKSNWGSKSMSATNFPNDLTEEYNMGLGANPGKLISDRGASSLASFLGRVNYTLFDKYIFTASYRADGSSKFTDKNKWAGFLSGAFAWRLSEEQFIKNLNLFSNLKLRLSYGETGNQAIGSYRTLPALDSATYPFAGSTTNGFAEVDWRGPVSEDLKWETTSQYNAGIDMGFLNGRINFTVDYYYKKTRDLLQQVQIPFSTGFSSMLTNSGWVTNEGLELSGNFRVLQNTPLKWTIDANISFNRNKIGGLAADQYAQSLWNKADEVFIQRNGCPIGAIYGYVEDGFYDNLAEVMASPDEAVRKKGKSMIGEIKYKNFDDDPLITSADRVIIGDTNPDFVYGITNNFEWKNFTLSFFLQGSQGNDIFNGNLMDMQMANIGNVTREAYNGRWTAENAANATWPKAIADYSREMKISNRYVEDGSYLKLKNLNIGYKWTPKFKGISNVNVYASATNLFTITGYSWFDPEVSAFGTDASRRGVDIYSYPSSRTFSLGVKIGF